MDELLLAGSLSAAVDDVVELSPVPSSSVVADSPDPGDVSSAAGVETLEPSEVGNSELSVGAEAAVLLSSVTPDRSWVTSTPGEAVEMGIVELLEMPSGLSELSELPVDSLPSEVEPVPDELLVSGEGVEPVLSSEPEVEPLGSSSGIAVEAVAEGAELDSGIAFDVVVSLSGCSVLPGSAVGSEEAVESGDSVESELLGSIAELVAELAVVEPSSGIVVVPVKGDSVEVETLVDSGLVDTAGASPGSLVSDSDVVPEGFEL